MKYPWMPLFWGDFLANTMHLSAQEIGAYFFLIAHFWEHDGKILTTRSELRRVSRVRADHWPKVWARLSHFFHIDGDPMLGSPTWVSHDRVLTELRHAAELSNKRKDAAVQMHSKRNASASVLHMQMHPHLPSPSPTESSLNDKSIQPRARQGMSPDKGDHYRSPPKQKSTNVLQPLPEQQNGQGLKPPSRVSDSGEPIHDEPNA